MSIKTLNEDTIIELIEKITFKTIGCTEPIAIALAISTAYKEIGGEIDSITVFLDKNVYKNAMAVGIPGTNLKGIQSAIALGLVCGDPSKELLLLESVTDLDLVNAKKILEKDLIKIDLNEQANNMLSIEAKINTSNGSAKVIIAECHNNIISIERNGQTIFRKLIDDKKESVNLDQYDFSNLQFDKLISLINNIPEQKISFLLKGFEFNKNAAAMGLQNAPGMRLGVGYEKLIKEGMIEDSFINRVKMIASAAVDARMGGLKVPIFGCTGSGNHGIMFFITVGMCFEYYKTQYCSSLAHAYTMGLVVLSAIKQKLGLLSPLCGGAIAAGAAAAAAITYILGGNAVQINNAINLMFGNIAGMVCDGAKYGCALKINNGAVCAIESALLSINDVSIPESDGIIGSNFAETLFNISLLNSGMSKVDSTVLEVLKNKQR